MKTLNEFKMSFLSDSRNESLARVAVASFISALDPSISELTEIKTAVSEAVTNSIVHGYRGTAGRIEMTAKIEQGGVLYIKVKDWGCGMADVEKAMEPLYTSAPEEERAGLGFAVMESFMDSLRVTSAEGRGTTIIMRRAVGEQ